MAETHELRLKIDAAAAQRGSRDFTSAIDAIKRAVRNLERDSSGAFATLKKNIDSARADLNKGVKANVSTGGRGGSGAARKEAADVAASQGRIQKSIRDTQLQTEKLTTSLMKVGSFGAMSDLHHEFNQFNRTASKAGVTTKELAAAKEKYSAATAKARTSLTTMTAKLQDEKRALAEAAAAEKSKTSATLSASAALRKAELDTQRLSNQMKRLGDTGGVTALNSALATLRGTLASGTATTTQVKVAVDKFAAASTKAKSSVIALSDAQRTADAAAKRLAQGEKSAAANARKMEADMRSAAGASNAASHAWKNATGNLRGLENAFSGTYQAASMFRNLMGTITLGTFVHSVYDAGNALDQFRVTMQVASDSQAEAQQQMQFVNDTARNLGIGLRSARDDYSKFAVASNIAGVSTQKTQQIFESVSTAMAVLGKSTEDQKLAFMALEQMMSKGKVSSEELRRQLGERLPGAVGMMADALSVTTDELQDLLKAGAINSADALPKFAEEIMKRYGPGFEAATRRAGYSVGTFRNEIEYFLETAAQSGFMQELAIQFRDLTDLMRAGGAAEAAEKIGRAMADMARVGGNAAQFLIENMNEVGRVVKYVAMGVVFRQLTLMGAAFMTSAQRALAFGTAALTMGSRTATSTSKIKAQIAMLGAHEAATTKSIRTLGNLGKAASVFGVLGRGLSVLAGPVGIAAAAVSILPMLFSDTADDTHDAVDASLEYERAMNRLETATYSFVQTARKVPALEIMDKVNTEAVSAAAAASRLENLQRNGVTTGDYEGARADFAAIQPKSPEQKAAKQEILDLSDALKTTDASGEALTEQINEFEEAIKENRALLNPWDTQLQGLATTFDEIGKANKTFNAAMESSASAAGETGKAYVRSANDLKRAEDSIALIMSEFGRVGEGALIDPAVFDFVQESGSVVQRISAVETAMASLATEGVNISEPMRNAAESVLFLFDQVGKDDISDIEFAGHALEAMGVSVSDISSVLQDGKLSFGEFSSAVNSVDLSELEGTTLGRVLSELASYLFDAEGHLYDMGAANESAATRVDGLSNSLSDNQSEIVETTAVLEGLIATMHALPNITLNMSSSLEDIKEDFREKIELASITDESTYKVETALRTGDTGKAFEALNKQVETHREAVEAAKAEYGEFHPETMLAGSLLTQAESALQSEKDSVRALATEYQTARDKQQELFREARKADRESSGGGGGSKKKKSKEEQTAYEKLHEAATKRVVDIHKEITAEKLLREGKVKTAEAAEMMAEQMMLPLGEDPFKNMDLSALIAEAERAGLVLEDLAEGPMDKLKERFTTLREEVNSEISGAMSDVMTSVMMNEDMDFEQMGIKLREALARSLSDFVSGTLMESLGNWANNMGGRIAGHTGLPWNKEDGKTGEAAQAGQAISQPMIQAGHQVGQIISQAMMTGAKSMGLEVKTSGTAAGAQIGTQVQTAATAGGTSMATSVQTGGSSAATQMQQGIQAGGSAAAGQMAAASAGGKTGGLAGLGSWIQGVGAAGPGPLGPLMAAGTLIAGAFSEGGISNGKAPSYQAVPVSAFQNAPHFKNGTANTSGIPAVLHDNEAVVPLSGGRKIPVDVKGLGEGKGSGITFTMGDINVNVEGSGDGEQDQDQAVKIASAIQERMDMMIEEKLVQHSMYGGMMNPRG